MKKKIIFKKVKKKKEVQATPVERGMLREGKADLLSHSAKHMPQNDPNEGGRELGIYTKNPDSH